MSNSTEDNKRSNHVLRTALVGGFVLWLAFPPAGRSFLAWPGVACWCYLCLASPSLRKRDYRSLYLAGLMHWLLTIHWVRLPHWSAYFGWLALAGYLAVYLPAFVWLTRTAIRRFQAPLVLVAPVVWVGLEAIRARAFTGFGIALLSHTQVYHTKLIQVCDLFGAYTLSFIIVAVAAALAQITQAVRLRNETNRGESRNKIARLTGGSAIAAALLLAATLWYGERKCLNYAVIDRIHEHPPIAVALIQGCQDTLFDGVDHSAEIFDEHVRLSQDAAQFSNPPRLIVWPESMYAFPWATVEDGAVHADDDQIRRWENATNEQARRIARAVGVPMLVGAPRFVYGTEGEQRFNSAIYLDSEGATLGIYDKMHPVLFGEYVPLGKLFPWLYRLTPMGSGLEAGDEPKCFRVGPMKLSPSICFENTVAHLIRRQCRKLEEEGNAPDALVTISNDGWFWGSSLLDMHLACGVFRAVEMRRTVLIAANTGFSAWVNDNGQIAEKGPRHATAVVPALVESKWRPNSVYYELGDVPVGTCAALCVALALLGWSRPPETSSID